MEAVVNNVNVGFFLFFGFMKVVILLLLYEGIVLIGRRSRVKSNREKLKLYNYEKVFQLKFYFLVYF